MRKHAGRRELSSPIGTTCARRLPPSIHPFFMSRWIYQCKKPCCPSDTVLYCSSCSRSARSRNPAATPDRPPARPAILAFTIDGRKPAWRTSLSIPPSILKPSCPTFRSPTRFSPSSAKTSPSPTAASGSSDISRRLATTISRCPPNGTSPIKSGALTT